MLLALPAHAQQTLFNDSFETGDFSATDVTGGTWNIIDNTCQTAAAAANDGVLGARIKKGGTLEKNISTVGYTNIQISYMRASENLSAAEPCIVQWSVDGTNWTTLETITDASPSWLPFQQILPAAAEGQPNLRIRFDVQSSAHSEKLHLDQVVITATSAANIAPSAVADSYSTSQNQTLEIDAAAGLLANDSDSNGDTLTAVITQNANAGQLVANSDGSFSYTPQPNFAGNVSFSYMANDGAENSLPVDVVISVVPVGAPSTLPNVVFLTCDDLSLQDVNVYGRALMPDLTPNMDSFAAQGIRFNYAHTQASNCTPSRNVIATGRFQHNSGIYGFGGVNNKFPAIVDLFHQAGYLTAIRGKVHHSSPHSPYAGWDYDLAAELGHASDDRTQVTFYDAAVKGIQLAQQEGKPFFMQINIKDPHTGFYGYKHKTDTFFNDPDVPSRVYTAAETVIPGYIPAIDPAYQDNLFEEWAAYYSNVRRADDSFGYVMQALDDMGAADDTLVVFLSDHGNPFMFVKTQVYHHSTHTPLMARWPNVISANSVDDQHVVQAVDVLPTFCDIIGLPYPAGIDGRSFEPLLKGGTQTDRDYAYKVFYEDVAGNSRPMRAVESKNFTYIFNPWSDGVTKTVGVSKNMETYRQLAVAAPHQPEVQARLDMYTYRVREEFYDVANDPDCLNNLIDDPAYATELADHRAAMEAMMVKTHDDDILVAFQNRSDEQAVQDYIALAQSQADARNNDPFYARDYNYAVRDGWLTLSDDGFENGFSSWTTDTPNATTIQNDANYIHTGSQSAQLDDSEPASLFMANGIDASPYTGIKLDFGYVSEDLENADSFDIAYADGGASWNVLDSFFKGTEISGTQYEFASIEVAPSGTNLLSSNFQFGFFTNFSADADADKIYFDDIRVAGWKNWSAVSYDDFEIDLGSWSDNGSAVVLDTSTPAYQGNASVKLEGGNQAAVELSQTIDASQLDEVLITVHFTSNDMDDDSDGFELQYSDGSQWHTLESYAYQHAFLNGEFYSDSVVINKNDHSFSSQLNLRIVNHSDQSDDAIWLDLISVFTR